MRRRSRTRSARSSSPPTSTPWPARSSPPSRTSARTMRIDPDWRVKYEQAAIIARATFDGFVQSDLTPSGMQVPAIIWAAAFLVGPALFLPAQHMVKYPLLRRFHPERVEGALWNDRLLFLLLSAGAIGLVSVVLWDTLFPARRDAFVLTPLPVPVSVQMLGRLGGLMTLCGFFV